EPPLGGVVRPRAEELQLRSRNAVREGEQTHHPPAGVLEEIVVLPVLCGLEKREQGGELRRRGGNRLEPRARLVSASGAKPPRPGIGRHPGPGSRFIRRRMSRKRGSRRSRS